MTLSMFSSPFCICSTLDLENQYCGCWKLLSLIICNNRFITMAGIMRWLMFWLGFLYLAQQLCDQLWSCVSLPSHDQLQESSTWCNQATQKILQSAFCGPSSRRLVQKNRKEQGVQIRPLIMRNDDSVLCSCCPTRDCHRAQYQPRTEESSLCKYIWISNIRIKWDIKRTS